MRSLRARLLAGGITYAEQRSFLLDRVDQQAQSALGPVAHALDLQVYGDGIGGAHDRDGGPGGSTTSLPPGSYGQKRGPDGSVLARLVPYSTGKTPPAPKLPTDLTPGKTITVGATGGSGLHYRVLAETDPDNGGLTVVAVPLSDADQTLSRLLTVEILVIGGVLLALGLLAWGVVRVGLRPLDRMGRTADAIAAGDLTQRVEPASERTEVGRLGLALNTMLDRLEQAFTAREASEERLRRFLADASHELRTPLASIRGYSELFRMGAAEDPADTRKAMRRIEDEAARMGVLVEDLLTLARLDAVREPVREPVALAGVTQEAVEDARVVAADRAIALDVQPVAAVLGDRLELRQVLDNLLRNAAAH
ncbi:MAG TPA: HAMP domain-containing sensor histidine kinase, partial [Solirubrobacteraceae bacterium]